MSFRAVVMRDPTVLLCAFSDVIVGCRMRRFARGREGAARAEKPMRYRSNDERKMFKDPTRSAVEIGGTSTFGGVILGGRPISEECA